MRNSFVFSLLIVLSSCSALTGKREPLLLSKQFGDGCEMVVEMNQSDSLSRLRVSVHLSEKKYAAIAGTAEMLKLHYGMDSAFYILQGERKVYADAIQPVMTVSKERFDYLIFYYGGNMLSNGKASLHFREPAPLSGEYAIELTSN